MSPEQSPDIVDSEIEIGLDEDAEVILSRLTSESEMAVVIMGFETKPEARIRTVSPRAPREVVSATSEVAPERSAASGLMEFPLEPFLASLSGNPTPKTPLIVFRAPDHTDIPTTIDAPIIRLPRRVAKYHNLELGLTP